MEDEINMVPQYKGDIQRELIDFSPTVPIGPGNYIPIMIQEDVERRNEIFTDLDTRSKEITAQLILGQLDIEKMDEYVAELNALGLKDMVAIDQRSLDRNDTIGK